MPLCPACKTVQTRRVNDACPSCGEPIVLYNSTWISASIGSPNTALVRHFEGRVRQALNAKEGTQVYFSIPRKGARWRRELAAAKHLLKLANNDLELAATAIDMLFDDRRWNWRYRNTLLYLERDYTDALNIAKARKKQDKIRKQREQQRLNLLDSKEDVFGNRL